MVKKVVEKRSTVNKMGMKIEIIEDGSFGARFHITNKSGETFSFRFHEKIFDNSVLIYSSNQMEINFGVIGEFKITKTHEQTDAIEGVKSLKGVVE